MDPSAGFMLDTNYYSFKSSVLHIGSRRDAGHYVTIAMHEAPTQQFWLYDDSRRLRATEAEVQASGKYRFNYGHEGVLNSYGAFFERQ